MSQMQLLMKPKSNVRSTIDLLRQRADESGALAAPYTLLVRQENRENYTFIAYSLGRPRNIVWGQLYSTKFQGEGRVIQITDGCEWNDLKIINTMLKSRQMLGYYVIGSIAKDQANMRIFGELIYQAYTSGAGVTYGKHALSGKEVRDRMMEESGLDERSGVLIEAARRIALTLLDEKNLYQHMSSPKHKIPVYVGRAIYDYLEYNPTLRSGSLPEQCPIPTVCDDADITDGRIRSLCELYTQPDNDLL